MNQAFSIIKERVSEHSLIAALTIASGIAFVCYKMRSKDIKKVTILDTIGETPLIYLPKLSKAAKCHIYVTSKPLRPNWNT